MIRNLGTTTRIFLAALCLQLTVFLDYAGAASSDNPTPNQVNGSVTNKESAHLQPSPDDGSIAFLTARLLQDYHYSHQRFDDSVSSQFLDQYVDSLDPQHLHFLQSDITQFERYRTNLDNLTINRRNVADTSPAYEIFARFMERLQQRMKCSDDWLKTEKFNFDTDEKIAIDRKETPFPKDLNEAKVLWLQRLRFEYLQEKLALDSKAKTPKNNSSTNSVTQPEKSVHEQIVDTLSHRYHRTLRMFTDWNNEDVLGIYLTALAHVYDPHSDYFNKEQLDSFKISMNLQLFGIGAELRSEDGYCKIERLLSGGPAIKSKKISPGDKIVAVAQGDQPPVDVVDMSLTKAVQLIRGPKGTEVRLTILPTGVTSSERKIVSLIRDEIPLEDQAAKGKIIDLPEGKDKTRRLGVITLPSFYAPMDTEGSKPVEIAGTEKEAMGRFASADVARLLAKFKRENVSGVILDLRFNGGGSLEEAIRLTGLFIKQGPVVQVKDLEGRVKADLDSDSSVIYDGPLVVLTSRFSASASEIVAGALQDYGRALIVGDTSTHGKGTVQTVTSLRPMLRLSDTDPKEPGALKFTIRKFYRASGASTQWKGVLPDIVLPSKWNYAKDIGESSLKNSLEWDTIPGADYEKLNRVQPYLAELLKRSTERIATNQDFIYVREDIEEFRKLQSDKSISLNEKQRLKENEEAETRRKAREKELRARKDLDEKVYEISLKQAGIPGLPAPVQKTNSVAKVDDNTGETNTASSGTVDPHADSDADEKVPAVDVNLQEAERILVDYLSALPQQQNAFLVTH